MSQATGDLVWGNLADPHVAAVITTSPSLHEGVLYGGVSSLEENIAAGERARGCAWLLGVAQGMSRGWPSKRGVTLSPSHVPALGANYSCCTFRGSAVAINASSGALLWQTYSTPSNGGQPGGWSGSAIWGSSPVVDRARGHVVVSTGDNYG